MKKTLLFLGILLIINLISASPIYNWRYQGASNEPSTSYYSGYWNSYSSGSSSGSSYVSVSQKLKTFNGPYTQVHVQNTQPYPRAISTPKSESNNFKAGGGYTPSAPFYGGYGYYGGYGGCYGGCGYYGYSYYSPVSYGIGYSYSYYDSYYPAYYW